MPYKINIEMILTLNIAWSSSTFQGGLELRLLKGAGS